jgi:hypothetical protein
VGPPHVVRATLLSGAAGLALAAAVLLVAGIVKVVGGSAAGMAYVGVAAATLAAAELFRRMARPDPVGPLTILVGIEDLGFERGGRVLDQVRRAEVGVVVIEEEGRSGVQAVSVRGHQGELMGRWETGWLGKGSIRPYRALRRHDWPRAIRGSGTVRWASEDAPSWVRDKVG